MSKTDLAVVLARFLGLYFMINAIYGFGQSAMLFISPLLFGSMNQFTTQLLLNVALPQLFGILIGLILWRKAPSIGQKMAS